MLFRPKNNCDLIAPEPPPIWISNSGRGDPFLKYINIWTKIGFTLKQVCNGPHFLKFHQIDSEITFWLGVQIQ